MDGEMGVTTSENPVHPSRRTRDCAEMKRRLDVLRTDRSKVEGVWDQIDKFVMPLGSVASPSSQASEGTVDWKRWKVWDSTAIDAHQKLAASIHGSITSPASVWFKPVWRDAKLAADKTAASWLEKAGDTIFNELQDSDFTVEIQSAYQDLCGPGNSVVIEEPLSEREWKGLDFTCVPLREAFFEEDSHGGIDTFYRLLSFTAVQVKDLCRRKGWPCPKDIEEKAAKPDSANTPIEIVFCIFKRLEQMDVLDRARARNRDRSKRRAAQAMRAKRMPTPEEAGVEEVPVEPDDPMYPLAPHLRPVGCCYFRAENGECVGEEDGYYEMPVFVCRWEKTTGSRWGHGPGTLALPTVKSVNAWLETAHLAAEKGVEPSWGVTELGLLSDLDSKPGGLSVFRSKDDVWTLEAKTRPEIAFEVIQDERAQIRRFFHGDDLSLKDSPQMTAMEAQIRYELMQRVLGAPLNRIENDLLSPIVSVAFGHLMRAGRLGDPPESVKAALADGGADFNIEYLGPLARSQRTDRVASIERLFAFAGALLKMGLPLPFIRAHVDFSAGFQEMAKLLGTPADLIKSEADVEKALGEMQAMEKRMQDAVASKAEGEANGAHATALAAMQGGKTSLPPGPMPAQPPPVIGPSYQPTQPFVQPGVGG